MNVAYEFPQRLATASLAAREHWRLSKSLSRSVRRRDTATAEYLRRRMGRLAAARHRREAS